MSVSLSSFPERSGDEDMMPFTRPGWLQISFSEVSKASTAVPRRCVEPKPVSKAASTVELYSIACSFVIGHRTSICCLGGRSVATSSFVRRRTTGAMEWDKCASAAAEPAFSMGAENRRVKRALVPSRPGLVRSIRAHSSSMRFSTGVPVSAMRVVEAQSSRSTGNLRARVLHDVRFVEEDRVPTDLGQTVGVGAQCRISGHGHAADLATSTERAVRSPVDIDRQVAGGELLDLTSPIADQGCRAHHQKIAFTARGSHNHVGNGLQSLAQPHLVGENSSTPGFSDGRNPGRTVHLIRPRGESGRTVAKTALHVQAGA